jgi:hypothetical protein
MKNIFLVLTILISMAVSAQIIVIQPVEVPADMTEKFLDVELNYSKKIAQDAVNKGELEGWAVLRNTNPAADGYNYLWVNVYKDVATAVNKGSWWNNAKEVVGVETSMLYGFLNDLKMDQRYYYKQDLMIESIAAASYVIFNFTNSTEVEKHTQELEQYVVPHFKKMMPKSGMVGWGLSSKITPQGDDFATMMVYDSYDSLENAMIHLSGGGPIAGLPHEKISTIEWSMRPLLEVVVSTGPKK